MTEATQSKLPLEVRDLLERGSPNQLAEVLERAARRIEVLGGSALCVGLLNMGAEEPPRIHVTARGEASDVLIAAHRVLAEIVPRLVNEHGASASANGQAALRAVAEKAGVDFSAFDTLSQDEIQALARGDMSEAEAQRPEVPRPDGSGPRLLLP